MADIEKKGEVAFNLGASHLQLIGELIGKSSKFYLSGEIDRWFYTLKAIKLKIIGRLDETECEELEKKETEFHVNHKKYSTTQDIRYRSLLGKSVEDYDNMIMRHLESKGFLVPLKEERTDLFDRGEE